MSDSDDGGNSIPDDPRSKKINPWRFPGKTERGLAKRTAEV
jgi:hypothetical protein